MSKICGECVFFPGCSRYEGKTHDSEEAETCRAYLACEEDEEEVAPTTTTITGKRRRSDMNKVTTDCGCCVYVHNGQCLGPVPCPGIFIPGDVIKTASLPTSYYDVKKSEVIKAEPIINDDGIWMPEHEYFRADSGCQYRLVMTPDMFREAWRRYVKGD